MMTVNKYRAWIPDVGVMVYSDNPDSMDSAGVHFSLEPEGLVVLSVEGINDDTELVCEAVQDATIMQYFQPRDKAIYDGDIIKCEFPLLTACPFRKLDEYTYSIGVVKDIGVGICIQYVSGESQFYDNMGENFSWDDCEVIGNIHENPELMRA